jgi:hypothetical protein
MAAAPPLACRLLAGLTFFMFQILRDGGELFEGRLQFIDDFGSRQVGGFFKGVLVCSVTDETLS